MIDPKKIFKTRIDWKRTKCRHIFAAVVNDKEFWLRLNDFPEEPLCTLIWAKEGEDLSNVDIEEHWMGDIPNRSIPYNEQDLDDLGKRWTLPGHRGE